jgi:hypothetical protein
MVLDKKLGIWGKDEIVRKDGKYYAPDFYCVGCYKEKKEVPASKFFPYIDVDIPSFPYCDKCIEKLTLHLFLEIEKDERLKRESKSKEQ